MNNNTPHKPHKNRHAKRHAAEQTEPFVFDELETRSQEFRNDRRLRGAQQANADWVAPNHWTNGCLASMPGTPT